MSLAGTRDTIAAIATPPGRGGIAVVRISGPLATDIARRLLGRLPAPRTATRARFTDGAGTVIDDGLALRFDAPHSFTGEDVVELQGHGGAVVSRMVLDRVCELGARAAKAGEFTLRAFLNDRIDLAQAEAIADLVDSATASAARCARRSLSGEFSRAVEIHRDALVELRAFIEASIDFPDEEIDLPGSSETAARLAALRDAAAATLAASHRGAVLRNGVRLVIAGAPNVGKSSLLNRLARSDTAIVTDIPGTTRDVVRERVVIAGIPFDVHDTAGFRETSDPVERIGVERAGGVIDDADLVLVVVDDRDGARDADRVLMERTAGAPARILVRNKVDLSGRAPGPAHGRRPADAGGARVRSPGSRACRAGRRDSRPHDARCDGWRRCIHGAAAPSGCAAPGARGTRASAGPAGRGQCRRARRRGASRSAGRARRDHRSVCDRGSAGAHLLELLYRQVGGRAERSGGRRRGGPAMRAALRRASPSPIDADRPERTAPPMKYVVRPHDTPRLAVAGLPCPRVLTGTPAGAGAVERGDVPAGGVEGLDKSETETETEVT